MAKIAIVSKADYSIASKYDADAPAQHLYGGPWGDALQFAHVAIPAELDHEVVAAQDDGEDGVEFVVDEDKAEAKLEAQWEALRQERTRRLAACDYTQVEDSPLSAPQKAEWATYRQELRDLPENTEDPAAPEWPEQP